MAELLPEGGYLRFGQRDKDIDAAAQAKADAPTTRDQKFTAFAEGIARDNYTSRWFRENYTIGNPFTEDFITPINRPTFEADPEYRFEDDELNLNYDPAQMVQANSAAEAQSFRDQIDRERSQLELIDASSWGVAGQMYGGIMQPHVLAAVAAAPASVPGMLAIEGAGEVASELMLHNMEKTRTIEESYMNVGLTLATVGILGGASAWMRASKSTEPGLDAIDQINAGSAPGALREGDSAGASRVLDEDIYSASDDSLVGGAAANFFSIGQMSNLLNSASGKARAVAQKLADNPLFTKAMAKGKTRGVTVEALQEAAMGRVVIAADVVSQLGKKSGMKMKDFDEQVGIAMSAGDRHANPQVAEAAAHYRKEVLEPIREASERLGLLESADEVKLKVDELEAQVKQLLEEGAGPGSQKAMDEVEMARAKIVAASNKKQKVLEKKIANLDAKLAAARMPDETGKKGTASGVLMKQSNDAKKALTEHKKALKEATKDQRATLRDMKKRKQDLAKARSDLRAAKTKMNNPGVAFAESYFPRIYDKEAIFENWDMLKLRLEEHFKQNAKVLGDLEAAEISEMAIDTLQNMVGGRGMGMTGRGVPSPLRARVLSLYDQELEALGIVEKNATTGMIRHAQAMQPYLIMKEAFDGKSLDELIVEIQEEYKILMNKPGVDAKKLSTEMGKDIDRLNVIHNRLMHNVQRAVNPRNVAEKVTQFAKVWNTTTYLGGITLSSIPDLARPIANYGLRSFGKGIAAMVMGGLKKGSMSNVQAKRTGAMLQRTLNDRIMQMTDSMEPVSKVEKGITKAWQKLSGFAAWTDTMESIASHAAMDWTLRMAEKVAAGKTLAKADMRQIARMGLNSEDLMLILRESEGTRGAQDSVLKYMNTMAWTDPELAKRVEAAIGSDVRRTIIRIGAGEKPEFMDRNTFSLLFQFQSFAMSAQNKIMVAGMQNLATTRTAASVVSMTALGATVAAIKAEMRGDDVSKWPPGKWVAEGFDRSGMSGALRIPFSLLRYGISQADAGADFLGEPSRFLNREVEGTFGGPTVSTLGRFARAIGSGLAGEGGDAAEHLSKAVPLANAWHIRDTLMNLGDN